MARDGWRFALLAREANRNVFGRGSRLRPLVAIAVILGVAQSGFIALENDNLDRTLDTLRQAGRNIVVFQSTDAASPAIIDRASCEALAGESGVAAAGLLVPMDRQSAIPLGTSLNSYRASSTLVSGLQRADVVVGSALGEGRAASFTLQVEGMSAASAIIGERQPTGIDTNSAIVLPLAATERSGESCVVAFGPLVRLRDAIPVVRSQLSVSGNPVAGVPVLLEPTSAVDGWLARPGRYLPLLLGLIGALVVMITSRLRASEVATYRLSGTSIRSITTLMSLEVALLGAVAAVSATATALVLAPHYPDLAVPLLWAIGAAGLWSIAVIAVAVSAARQRPTDLAKDR